MRKNFPYAVQSGLQQSVLGYWHPLSLNIHTVKGGQSWHFDNIRVLAVPDHYDDEPHKGVIGMNVLMQGGFRLDGKTGTAELWW